MKNTVSWVLRRCISETALHFGGKYHIHLQDLSENQAGNKQKQMQTSRKLFCWLLSDVPVVNMKD